jgi:hypothetical protein
MAFSSSAAAAALLLLLLQPRAARAQLPDQVHLSLSGVANEMVVEFVTHSAPPAAGAAYVLFSTDPSTLIAPSTPSPPNASAYPGLWRGAGYLIDGYDLLTANMTVAEGAAWCEGNSSCAGFTFADADETCGGRVCYLYFKTGLQFAASGGWTTLYKTPQPIPNATATSFEYMNATLGPIGWMNTAVLRNLLPNTRYYYVCGQGASDWSPLKWFTNAPADRDPVFAVFADFGYVNDESVVALYADTEAQAFDYIIHAGDFAYDFDSNNGLVGNDYMRMAEGFASFAPYMPAPGNHESHMNYSQYQARFAGVAANAGANSGSGSALYYSLDVGLVHWVFFSTEVFWSQADIIESQLNWLKADLAKANANRAAVPWIVVAGHKAWNMDNNGACGEGGASCTNATWSDSLMHDFGADLFFVGHMHEYRRFSPAYGTKGLVDTASMSADTHTVTDPKYLVTITSGVVGCPEVQPASCGGPTPGDPANPTAACSRNYGYGYLTVHNATHASWRWRTSVPHAGSPDPFYTDTMEIIVNSHGPRPPVS